MNELILDYLKKYPAFRERKNKNKWVGGVVFKKYNIPMDDRLKDLLADIVTDIQNADRYWRMHTAEHAELRGTDYDTKMTVEQAKQIELGYEPNYHNDIKPVA